MATRFSRYIGFGLSLLAFGLYSKLHYAWNSVGHRLVAQIAYEQLTPQAKNNCNLYNHALDKVFSAKSFVGAAPWLDKLRYRHKRWLQSMHYIDKPLSIDGTVSVPPNKVNAVTAIHEAIATLTNKKASTYDKGFALRILLHVVGDIHQPLHTVSTFSKQYPKGDQGGNLILLASNSVAANLHVYWDNGGGLLKKKHAVTSKEIAHQAQKINKLWPCEPSLTKQIPEQWAEESYLIAINKAYRLPSGNKPTKSYQRLVKTISAQRIAQAGCRLGSLLNQIAST